MKGFFYMVDFNTLFNTRTNSRTVKAGTCELSNTLAHFNLDDLNGFDYMCYAVSGDTLYFKLGKGKATGKHSSINGDKVRLNGLKLNLEPNTIKTLEPVKGQEHTYSIKLA